MARQNESRMQWERRRRRTWISQFKPLGSSREDEKSERQKCAKTSSVWSSGWLVGVVSQPASVSATWSKFIIMQERRQKQTDWRRWAEKGKRCLDLQRQRLCVGQFNLGSFKLRRKWSRASLDSIRFMLGHAGATAETTEAATTKVRPPSTIGAASNEAAQV